MGYKPDPQSGQAKLQQWQQERERSGAKPPHQPARNTSPRGNGEADTRGLELSVERFDALLGR